MNVITNADDGTWSIGFRGKSERSDGVSISGTIRFTASGIAISDAEFRLAVDEAATATAHLAFSEVVLDGESFPILAGRGITHLATKKHPRQASVEEQFRYSPFVRAK